MSASLVGSEMCIRDRLFRNRHTRPTHRQKGSPSEARRAGTGFFRGVAAVSYTHLTLPTICSV
eukprot:13519125-Alexandrium_andersonii.AAC.1